MSEDWHTSILGGPGPFPATSWSLIGQCRESDRNRSEQALDLLISKYWRPVYFYIYRNWTREVDKAKDRTQAFFTTFLEKDYLGDVQTERGRFRSFVCSSLRNFLLNEKRYEAAKKRQPQGALVSLDELREVDGRFDVPDPRFNDPERQFTEDWKRSVLDEVMKVLRRDARQKGREVLVDLLVEYDLDRAEGVKVTYEDLAGKYSMSVHQVRNGLHWIRNRFMKRIRREIEEQVDSREAYDREVTSLFGAG